MYVQMIRKGIEFDARHALLKLDRDGYSDWRGDPDYRTLKEIFDHHLNKFLAMTEGLDDDEIKNERRRLLEELTEIVAAKAPTKYERELLHREADALLSCYLEEGLMIIPTSGPSR